MRMKCVDCEATGLDLRDELKSIQVWEGKKGRSYKFPEDKELFLRNEKKDLEDPNVIKIIHNFEYDGPMIFWHTGVLITRVGDTKLQESIILGIGMQENNFFGKDPKYSTNLYETLKRRKIAVLDKTITALYYDPLQYQRYVEVYGKKKVAEMQDKYGMDDVKYLTELYLQQEEDIRELQLENVQWLENETAEVTAIMKINGIGCDEQMWYEIADETQAKYDEIWNSLPSHVSWSSPVQVKKFFARRGIRIKSYKEFWNPDKSVKKKWLGLDPDLDKFFEMQKLYKAITSYGIGWLTNKYDRPTIFDDGRVRCQMNQIVDTGRYSSQNPNLQQLPSKLRHRNAFRAAKGWTFCIGDYRGQELGIIAIGAKDQSWIKAMLRGDDVHSVQGAKLYNTKYNDDGYWKSIGEKGCTFPKKCECPKHNKLRRPVKDINFGLAYGKGLEALAEDMNCSIDEAADMTKLWYRASPDIKRWLDSQGKAGVKYRETFTFAPFYRRRVLLEDEEYRRRNQGKNTPIQGTGGDILKLALVRLYKYIRKHKLQDRVKIVLCVHDEIITEARHDFAEEWSVIMKRIMDKAAEYVLEEPVVTTDPFINKFWPFKDQNLKGYNKFTGKLKQAA